MFYQDDYRGLLVNGTAPNHWSGTLDGAPCNQMIVSIAGVAAAIDEPGCDWVHAAAGMRGGGMSLRPR
jgi:hypothetical protein